MLPQLLNFKGKKKIMNHSKVPGSDLKYQSIQEHGEVVKRLIWVPWKRRNHLAGQANPHKSWPQSKAFRGLSSKPCLANKVPESHINLWDWTIKYLNDKSSWSVSKADGYWGKIGVTAIGYRFLLGIMKTFLNCGDGNTTGSTKKNHWILHFKWVNCTVLILSQ